MKFDLIIGNPPYNRGIVKKHHPVYYHSAINNGREGTIGFLLDCLSKLKPNGNLLFITPIKFLRGPGCIHTRQFLFTNYNLLSVIMKNPKVFEGVGCDKIGVSLWTTGTTSIVSVDGVTINPSVMPDLIVPAFSNQDIATQYLVDIKNGLLGRPLGGPKPASQQYRVVFAKTFMRGFTIKEPGYQLGFYENCYEFNDLESANLFHEYTACIKFNDTWSSIQFQTPVNHVDSHCVSRYMPNYYDGIIAMRQSDFIMRYLQKAK